MFRFVSLRMVPVLLGLVPVAVAAAWIPFRNDLPNTDVALLLVLCVGAVAMIGGRWTAAIGAVTAATAFDLFDTPPYWQLYMTRGRDVVTTLILVGAGLLVGELCVRVRRYRVMAATRGEDFAVISSAARLMAVGEDASMVVEALAGELVARLGLVDCEFRYGPPAGDRPFLARDGSLIDLGRPSPQTPVTEIDLPVWAGTDEFTCTTAAPAFSSARTARETGSPRPTVGSGGDICGPRGSDGFARPATRAASRSRSTTDPTTSAAITGGSSFTTGNWDTSYSRSSAMAAPTFSSG